MSTSPKQKVRIEFLIALTVVVLIWGGVELVRRYSHTRRQSALEPMEQRLANMLKLEWQRLAESADQAPGRPERDAVALLVQVRRLRSRRLVEADAEVEEFQANYSRWDSGERPVFPRGRAFLRGYIAPQDGSLRPYSINVPEQYAEGMPTPLILFLHGHGGFREGQEGEAPSYAGAITVRPEGRRASDYMLLGEDDVLAVLEDVKAIYTIDEGRVFLVGHSMGGTGAWNLAVHHPDLFTGIVCSSGAADHGAWEMRWKWNPERDDVARELREFLHASFSPISYAENMAPVRAAVLHGTGDAVVPVEHAREMVARLRSAGAQVHYREFPAAGHGGIPEWARQDALAWLFSEPPAGQPERFSFRTASLRQNEVWWLRIDQLGEPLQYSTVHGAVEGGVATVTTENVNALTVIARNLPSGVQKLHVDAQNFDLEGENLSSERSFERREGRWEPAQMRGLAKRRGLSGPFEDVLRDAFIVVYGTGGPDELRKQICKLEAERFAALWALRYGSRPRVAADDEVGEEQRRRYNLVLIGGPETNAQTRWVAQGLPLQAEGGRIVFDGTSYTDPGAGILLCHPNPENPDRMVALVAGNSPAALYQALDRFGLWFNWGIYDKYKWFDYAVFDNLTAGPESFLHVGFFDGEWRLPGQWSLRRRAADALELAPQGFPGLAAVTDAQVSQLVLSDLLPTKIVQHRGAVGFDRTYDGRKIVLGGETFERGLGVKAPSEIFFDLQGICHRFNATVGLTHGFKGPPAPPRVEEERVVFEVWGDGELLAASPALSWKDSAPQTAVLSADVDGVFELRLVCRPEKSARTWLFGAAAWGSPSVRR